MRMRYFAGKPLTGLFQKYFENAPDKNIFSEFNLTQKKDDIIIENIDSVISDFIVSLEENINKYYFEILRVLMDTSKNLESKFPLIEHYFENTCGHFKVPGFIGTVHLFTQNMACNLSKIQILIDCLNEVKKLPKTITNIKICHQIAKNTYIYYSEDSIRIESFRQKGTKGAQPNTFRYNYFQLKPLLEKIDTELYMFINTAINTKCEWADEPKPSTSKRTNRKNKM